jgi:hypothetical protein
LSSSPAMNTSKLLARYQGGGEGRVERQIIACHAQLRLARPRPPAAPGNAPARPAGSPPARVRRGFRNIRAASACPAGTPKPGKPGPVRRPGSQNCRPAACHDVGKNRNKATPSVSGKKETG